MEPSRTFLGQPNPGEAAPWRSAYPRGGIRDGPLVGIVLAPRLPRASDRPALLTIWPVSRQNTAKGGWLSTSGATVEVLNPASQGYLEDDVGLKKVQATALQL